MGNQMFSPQENIPPRQYNTDPREQPRTEQSWQEVPPTPILDQTDHAYSEGYRGADPYPQWGQAQKIQPPRNIPTWQWIVGALILLALAPVLWNLINFLMGSVFLILGLAAVVIAISQFSVRKIALPMHVFPLSDLSTRPSLVITNPTGSIRVRRGTVDKVEVTATKYVNGWFGTMYEGQVHYQQEDNRMQVTSRSNYQWSPFGGLRNVDLEIFMPETSDLQIEGNAGTIRIEGISGQVGARTNAGTIHVEDISGQLVTETNAGTIHVERATLANRSSLVTNAGTIHVARAQLSGQVRMETNAGTVHFEGALDPHGHYDLKSNAGSVDVIVEGNPSFILEASTSLGSVNNKFGSTVVGPSPHARLIVHTDLGSVNVRPR